MPELLLPVFGIAFLVTLLCAFAFPVGLRMRLLDYPGGRKKHVTATPLIGGLALILVILPAIALWSVQVGAPSHVFGFVLATAAVTILGLTDDIYDLSATVRLIAATAIFLTLFWFEPIYVLRVLVFEYPRIDLGLIDEPIAAAMSLFALVGLVNAINMADGKNGLVIGLCIGWLVLLLTRAPDSYQPLILFLLAGLSILLIFNLRSKLFLGDGGAYGMATAVGLLSILIYNSPGSHAGRAVSAEEILILLIVPVFDSFRLIILRLKRGVSPLQGDREHLHHYIQDRWGWPRGLFVYWVIAICPAIIAFSVN